MEQLAILFNKAHHGWNAFALFGLAASGLLVPTDRGLLQVQYKGKVEPFQDDVFVVNGSVWTSLLAKAGTAIVTVREADECYFQTVSVLR